MIEESKSKGILISDHMNLSDFNSIHTTSKKEAKNIRNLKAASNQRKNIDYQMSRQNGFVRRSQ